MNRNKRFYGIFFILISVIFIVSCELVNPGRNNENDPKCGNYDAPPQGTFVINGGITETNAAAAVLTMNITDVVDMRFGNQDLYGVVTDLSEWEDYAVSKNWELDSSSDGVKTVIGEFRDKSGFISRINDIIIYDTKAPAKNIFTINNDASATNSTAVTITAEITDENTLGNMCFSSDGNIWSSWESYSATKIWNITDAEASQTIYARYSDAAGNVLQVNDSIIYDQTLPSGTMIINSDDVYTNNPAITITASVTDSGSLPSGMQSMRFSNNGTSWSAWEDYAGTKTWALEGADGEKNIQGQFRDCAGNVLAANDAIIYDITEPTATISIKGGDIYTNSPTVTLGLVATDNYAVDQMRFSNSSSGWLDDWEAYDTTKTWDCEAGDSGTRTVYAQFKDIIGNVRQVNDTIIYDNAAPSPCDIVINGGSWSTNSRDITLTLSAADNYAVKDMCFMEYRYQVQSAWTEWEVYLVSGSRIYTLSEDYGATRINIMYRDEALNPTGMYNKLIEYNPYIDLTFGDNGRAYKTVTPNETDSPRSIVLQSDGKILVGGQTGSPCSFAVTCFNPNGTIDTTFGSSGAVTTSMEGSFPGVDGMALQPDGYILACGSTYLLTKANIVLTRYNTSGALDTTFDSDGILYTPYPDTSYSIYAIDVAAYPTGSTYAGKIVTAGMALDASATYFLTAMFNADGTLYTSFDTDGFALNSVNGAAAVSVAIQSDDKIIAAGGDYFFALARYNTNGSLDTTFSSDGVIRDDRLSTGSSDDLYDIALQSDGKIIAVGSTEISSNYDVAVVRYNINGTLDTTFNSTGIIKKDFTGGTDYAASVTTYGTTPNIKILVCGTYTADYGVQEQFILRYNEDGSPDTTFADNGFMHIDNTNGYLKGIALQSDGKIVTAIRYNYYSGGTGYNAFRVNRYKSSL